MNKLLDLPAWVKVLIVVLIVGALYAAFENWKSGLIESGDKAGYARATAEWAAKEKAIEAAAEQKYAEELATAKRQAKDLQEKFDNLAVDRLKEKAKNEKAIERHVAAALANAERLSVPTAGASCSVPGEAKGEGTGPGAGTRDEARTDLLPATSAVIFRIAGHYGQLVRDYNDVVERYGIIRASCNDEPQGPTD